jgi:hypothetical protein
VSELLNIPGDEPPNADHVSMPRAKVDYPRADHLSLPKTIWTHSYFSINISLSTRNLTLNGQSIFKTMLH